MSREIKYIGLDVHKEATVIAVLNANGNLVMESIVETKASSLLQFIHGLRQSVSSGNSFLHAMLSSVRVLGEFFIRVRVDILTANWRCDRPQKYSLVATAPL
jgi:hypothetical protein